MYKSGRYDLGGLLRIPFHLNYTNFSYAKSKKDLPEFYVLMIFFPYATIPQPEQTQARVELATISNKPHLEKKDVS